MKHIFLIILLFTSAVSQAQESMMNDVSYPYLEKLIATARENYPRFKWTSAKVNAAKAAATRAKLGYLDFFTFTYIYNPRNTVTIYDVNSNTYNNYNNNNILRGYQLGVYVNIGNAVQKPAIVKQAKEEYNVARYDKEAVDLNLDTEVKQRYFLYLQQMNVLKVRSRALVDADDLLKSMKYKFEKGQVTFENYNQVMLSRSVYAQEKVTAEAQLLIAKSSLEEIIGTKLENVK
jgi:outer membrane protein TolC